MSQKYGNKRGTLTEEGSQGSQGSQDSNRQISVNQGNSMITQPVSQSNPYNVEVLSIKPVQSGSDALARADVSVSLSIPATDNATFNDTYNLYGIEVRRGKHKALVVEAPWVSRPVGWGPYFVPQRGGLQQVAITEAVLAAYRTKIKGLGVR